MRKCGPGPWIGMFLQSLLATSAGCSGDGVGVCGNGVAERGEACDCGNDPADLPVGCYRVNGAVNSSCSDTCETREVHFTKVIINWTINGESFLLPGQSFDTCNDVGAVWARVLLEGAGGFSAEEPHVACTSSRVEFVDDPLAAPLLPGSYNAWLELQTAEATPLAPLVQAEIQVAEGIDNAITLDFPLESFYDFDNFRGEFGIRPYWGADSVGCASAAIPVVERVLTLTQDGSPLAGFPDQGPCEDASLFIGDLIPGDYQLTVEGYDTLAEVQYCEEYDVKVGAGIQPAYHFVVPPIALSVGCSP